MNPENQMNPNASLLDRAGLDKVRVVFQQSVDSLLDHLCCRFTSTGRHLLETSLLIGREMNFHRLQGKDYGGRVNT